MFKKSIALDIVVGTPFIKGKVVTITETDEPGILNFKTPWPNKFNGDLQVVDIDWEEKGERSLGKAAVGAAVGGALTGGAGLLIGAAIGGKKKDKSTAVLLLEDEEGEQYKLYVRCKAKDFEMLIDMLHG